MILMEYVCNLFVERTKELNDGGNGSECSIF